MTNPTKQVAIGFSASAFLPPKHLPADKLFEWVDSDDLKKLKPSAERVRDAILECKKHGLSVRFSGGLALSISGDLEVLHTCFGVRLMIDSDPSAKERKWFEDDAGAKQGLVKPVANHPLGKHIVNIVLEPGIEPTIHQQPPQPPSEPPAPRYPGTNDEWGKREGSNDIWPHELQQRMSFKETDLDASEQAILRIMNSKDSPKFCVSMVDTGLNSQHLYFLDHWKNQGLLTNRRADLHRPEVAEFQAVRSDLLEKASAAQEELKGILDAAKMLLAQLHISAKGNSEYVSWDESKQKIILGGKMTNSPGNDPADKPKLDSAIKLINDSKFYKKYILQNQTQQSVQLQDLIHGFLGSIDYLWGGTTYHDYNTALVKMIEPFNEFLNQCQDQSSEILRWLNKYGKEGSDDDGHGTAMAASILGVAKTAQVACFLDIFKSSWDDITNLFCEQTLPLSHIAFAEMIEWINSNDKKLKGSLSGTPSHNFYINKLVEYKIISNSYSQSIRIEDDGQISNDVMEELADWRANVRDLTEAGVSILYSAGNSGNPQKTEVSLYALLGNEGAIIVGGAYYEQDPISKKWVVKLSNAAHGTTVSEPYTEGAQPVNPLKVIIPDVCGLVGPEYTTLKDDKAFPSGKKVSPYVYLPTSKNNWHYAGGGTSSACAQVASLCGALRAKYPRLDPLQIKQAIIEGGDPITEGTSYQGKTAAELNNVKLVNILGAFRKAAVMSGEVIA